MSLRSLLKNLTPPAVSRTLRVSLGACRFSCLRKKRRLSLICSVSYVLGPATLRWSWESPSPPINGVTRCQDSRSLARYHTIVICKGNHIKPPATRSPTQKYQSIVTHKFTSQKYHILENGVVPPH